MRTAAPPPFSRTDPSLPPGAQAVNDVAAESAIRIFAQHDTNFSGSLTLSEFSEALAEATGSDSKLVETSSSAQGEGRGIGTEAGAGGRRVGVGRNKGAGARVGGEVRPQAPQWASPRGGGGVGPAGVKASR